MRVGMFYYMLGNLSSYLRSQLRAIQLLAVCKTQVVERYGVDVILESFMTDLKTLEEVWKQCLHCILYPNLILLFSSHNRKELHLSVGVKNVCLRGHCLWCQVIILRHTIWEALSHLLVHYESVGTVWPHQMRCKLR